MEGKEAELRQKERELAATRRQVDQLNLDLQPLLQARSQVREIFNRLTRRPPFPDAPFSIKYVRNSTSARLMSRLPSPPPPFLALRCAPHFHSSSGVCYITSRRRCSRAGGHLKLRPWNANKEGGGREEISLLNSHQRTFFVFSVSKTSPGSAFRVPWVLLLVVLAPSHSGPDPDPYLPGSADPNPDV